MKIAQAYGAEAVAHQAAEEIAIAAHCARAQFLRAARQVALFDELGQRQRTFGLRVAAVDGRENLGDQRRDIFFRAVIVGLVGELLADPASDRHAILDFVLVEPNVPASVSAENLSLLHVFPRPPRPESQIMTAFESNLPYRQSHWQGPPGCAQRRQPIRDARTSR
jgi:hypothetical protein